MTCDHGLGSDCGTCIKLAGCCDFGGCGDLATWRLSRADDLRFFCEEHATDPRFGAMRQGYARRRLGDHERIDNSEQWERIAVGAHWPRTWERQIGDLVWTATLRPAGLRLSNAPPEFRGNGRPLGIFDSLRQIDQWLEKFGRFHR